MCHAKPIASLPIWYSFEEYLSPSKLPENISSTESENQLACVLQKTAPTDTFDSLQTAKVVKVLHEYYEIYWLDQTLNPEKFHITNVPNLSYLEPSVHRDLCPQPQAIGYMYRYLTTTIIFIY